LDLPKEVLTFIAGSNTGDEVAHNIIARSQEDYAKERSKRDILAHRGQQGPWMPFESEHMVIRELGAPHSAQQLPVLVDAAVLAAM
jgi:hypothetical protein